MLVITHPEFAFRDCAQCQAFIYDDDGKPVLWDGQPYPRGKVPTPCQTEVGCPKGSPDAGIELSEKNWAALSFHRRCEAVGDWPDDPVVRQNAEIIKRAEVEARLLVRERDYEKAKRRDRGRAEQP